MNKENAKDYLPLVRALAEGRTIQFFNETTGWNDFTEPTFTAEATNYRIKPEQTTAYMVVKSGKILGMYASLLSARDSLEYENRGGEIKRLVEDLEWKS